MKGPRTLFIRYGRCRHVLRLSRDESGYAFTYLDCMTPPDPELGLITRESIEEACDVVAGLLNDPAFCVFEFRDLARSQDSAGSACGAVARETLECLEGEIA